jgi:hypothetical protein
VPLGKKYGGRKKGTKNLKTQEKVARIGGAIASASTAVAALAKVVPAKTTRKSAAIATPDAVEVAIPGISPKDLMLTAMRISWAKHKEQAEKAGILEDTAGAQMKAALDLPALENEKSADHKARIARELDTAKEVLKLAQEARAEAKSLLQTALDCSTRAAPYEHAKLVTTDGKQDTQVTVVIQQF